MPNFKWSDLENKEVIGGRRGGMPAMTLEFALKKNNLIDGKNFKLNYDVKYDLIGASFESGVGDFCTMFEPAASNMQSAGKAYIVASVGKEAGDMPFTAFMATKSYIANNRAQVDAFTKSIVSGINYVHTHTAREIAELILPSFVGTSVETLANAIQSYKDAEAFCISPEMKQADFEHLQDVIVQAGIMQKRADFNKLVDNSIAKAFTEKK
ncbi:MAG: hypothetical protein RSD04_05475 [Clostridia bacterium]